MSEEELREAQIDHEAVRFSMGMALENPDMYSAEEKLELIERHEITKEEVDRIMREDLASMPPDLQEAMKRMLKSSNVPEYVWKEIFGEDF